MPLALLFAPLPFYDLELKFVAEDELPTESQCFQRAAVDLPRLGDCKLECPICITQLASCCLKNHGVSLELWETTVELQLYGCQEHFEPWLHNKQRMKKHQVLIVCRFFGAILSLTVRSAKCRGSWKVWYTWKQSHCH